MFTPLSRAIRQCFDDPVFRGVVLRSLLWSAACLIVLDVAAVWALQRLLDLHGWLGWAAGIVGGLGATLLAFWLFLPVAAMIGTFYSDRIAAAVEHRHYPALPPPQGASVGAQVVDGVSIGARILLLNIVALIAVLLLPVIGLVFAWLVGGYALGRGLFAAVALRRLPRPAADSVYRSARLQIVALGCVLAFMAYVPLLNLLIPVIGIAAMVHVLDRAMTEGQRRS